MFDFLGYVFSRSLISSKFTDACSSVKLTLASTPSILFNTFSIRVEQAAHVIPVISNFVRLSAFSISSATGRSPSHYVLLNCSNTFINSSIVSSPSPSLLHLQHNGGYDLSISLIRLFSMRSLSQ